MAFFQTRLNQTNSIGDMIMGVSLNEYNHKSKGGTELSIGEFVDRIPSNILDHFQIIPSRFRGLEAGKIPIYWAHDLPGDPECEHLKHGGYNQYEKLVFVSNWQMHNFINYYGIPWYKCVVLPNAVIPVESKEKSKDVIKLVYHTTPHRGLEILAPVFDKLCEKHDNIELDVFSSFKIYGWEERDKPYEQIFDMLRKNKKVRYHGFGTQEQVRATLGEAHIFAYPNIWPETGCRSLMESMTAGLLCVHPNYGCLYETAAGWTWMYQYHEDKRDHAKIFYHHLDAAISNFWADSLQSRLQSQRGYASVFYNWEMRKQQWTLLLMQILDEKKIKYDPGQITA